MSSPDTLVLDVLALTRALVEAGWCKNATAKSDGGREVPLFTPAATHWCLVGARYVAELTVCQEWPEAVLSAVSKRVYDLLGDAMVEQVGEEPWQAAAGLEGWNDLQPDKRPVLRLLDRAAAKIGKG